jgi:hypothetical protein
MPLFYKTQLQERANQQIAFAQKSAPIILQELKKSSASSQKWDVFLSHRYLDAIHVLGLKLEIEELGYSVFVDWIEKPTLDRAQVTAETAAWLRSVMKRCLCLLYAATENATDSKWMPWELGYSDGLHGKVAIVPIAETQNLTESYTGQEYLGIYPYVTKAKFEGRTQEQLWVNKTRKVYTTLRNWLDGKDLVEHP